MKNKMPKMDMGGLYTGASMSRDVENQPVSGYGAMEDMNKPKKPKMGSQGSGAKHAANVRKTQQKRTNTARKNIGNAVDKHVKQYT